MKEKKQWNKVVFSPKLVFRGVATPSFGLLPFYSSLNQALSKSNPTHLLNCHVKKAVSHIIVANELKMGLLYGNLYTSYVLM